ncbi:hypothetical protein K435DRAFT_862381 [Dendrothele bispora CBS 962.96]|uniref:Uncharacterized protein n=1 Tax=Dendrothele bispora (strain CBS 962.96) TaxID=1314807 RepID=A0A4S8LSN8_DENBC|nr:hypothetical protein K435DRAFT_862381 [Dendrothele bispora CBS 962.96]
MDCKLNCPLPEPLSLPFALEVLPPIVIFQSSLGPDETQVTPLVTAMQNNHRPQATPPVVDTITCTPPPPLNGTIQALSIPGTLDPVSIAKTQNDVILKCSVASTTFQPSENEAFTS